MAEMAVSFAIDQLLPLLTSEASLLRGVHKEFAYLKDELESIQAFLKDADRRAAADGDNTSEGVKTWVKQLRVAAFRIEDIIDEYMIHVGQQPRDHGCAAVLDKIAHLLKTMIPRHRIAAEIQDVKSSVRDIQERSDKYGFQRSFEQGSSSSIANRDAGWLNPRVAARYIEEADVVGFEAPRKRLIDWMVKGREERTVVSVVGMGGQGKTTLAKNVFDSKDVIGHFDCHVWITVSQSYNVEGILRDMLQKLHQQNGSSPPMNISQMDRDSLTDEVRNYLRQKRYVVVFDDIWNVHFWDDIQLAVIDNKKGSRILVTTRNQDVLVSCQISSSIERLDLQPLTHEQSLELFNKKVFKKDCDECCPKELIGIANEIVKHCEGLPLAVVVIGGLLSTREKNVFKWQRFRENLNLELKTNTHLVGITKILSLSYNDLPCYLKPCMLDLPEWMLDLQNLTELGLAWPYSDKDPLQSLKSLQHLLSLFLDLRNYEGLQLHFQDGWFQKLKELTVGSGFSTDSIELREIIIENGSMPSLKTLLLMDLPNLKNIPTGIQHLEKLEVLRIWDVEDEFGERISTEDWNWILEHVPLVTIYSTDGCEIKYSRC